MEQIYIMGGKHAEKGGYLPIVGKQVRLVKVDFFGDTVFVQALDDSSEWSIHGADLHEMKDTNAEMSFLLKEEL